jgi:hypothetical protein
LVPKGIHPNIGLALFSDLPKFTGSLSDFLTVKARMFVVVLKSSA